ncbi:MAG TPA: DUF192 domain-containing protein [Candidatus Paceibacterota bacterium]|nr:DUF192 domain-containing protein [Candidatus Paceibacterota bacterium]
MVVRALIVAAIVVAVLVALQPKGHSISFGSHTLRAEIADDVFEQTQGLSGRDSLDDDAAMLFVFMPPDDRAFWMKDVRFPIDIIWLRGDTVVGIAKNVQPEPGVPDAELARYRSPGPVSQVIEVVAGTADRLGIHDGDVMHVRR